MKELVESVSIIKIVMIFFLASGVITFNYLFISDLLTWISSYF
ncbi:hypothetical protein SAMN05216216_107104 [Lacicoccus qingdaonensis]|uniref:Uncharacterized protein n=1 Tax=Lacicoccus qingdaonensis TaxID=576118 RepID=A0A1G9E5L0_9BACL|nr:hypothetical protein SAMN05216216_107104 [Salinicoccus qingdaonensis]